MRTIFSKNYELQLNVQRRKKNVIMVTPHHPTPKGFMECNAKVRCKVQCQTAREKYVNLAPRAGHMHAA